MPITPSIAEVRRLRTQDAIRRITEYCFNPEAVAVRVQSATQVVGCPPPKDVEVIVEFDHAFTPIIRIDKRYAPALIALAAAQGLLVLRDAEPEEAIPDMQYE